MHFTDDPISDTHVKNYFIISCLKGKIIINVTLI